MFNKEDGWETNLDMTEELQASFSSVKGKSLIPLSAVIKLPSIAVASAIYLVVIVCKNAGLKNESAVSYAAHSR